MTVSGPRVRDYTATTASLDVVVDASETYEVLIGLYVYGEGRKDDTEYDDAAFFERIDERISVELKSEIDELGSCWSVWLSLLGVAWERELRTIHDLVGYLRGADPAEFRGHLLEMSGISTAKGHSPETIALAVAGDEATLEELLDAHFSGLRRLLETRQPESRDRVAAVIERFYNEAMIDELATTLPLLVRDASEKQALAKSMPADQLVESATRGVTFEPRPTIRGVVLIPTVVLSPWAVVTEHAAMRIFCYSVDVGRLAADPTAPPVHLIDLFKALGDERRLRLLGALAAGDADLKTLAESVDLAKSTTHHHLRVLRGAGLVRVVVSDHDKRYSLRKEGLGEAGPLLEVFLANAGSAAAPATPPPEPQKD
jgi:DNA-binding transcriptional ArsR family regulator